MQLTQHARVRSQQRGFSPEEINFILSEGIVRKKPGKANEIYIPKKEAEEKIKYHKFMIKFIEGLKKKTILVDKNGETIITTYCSYK